jgi:NhaP-type Na+/H+ or K+/H+ antiporter
MKLKITHLPLAILAFAMLLSISAAVSKSQTILDLSGVAWVIAGIILIGIAVGIVVMLLMEKFGHKK